MKILNNVPSVPFMEVLHQEGDEADFLPEMMPLRGYEKLLGLEEVEAAAKSFEVG